MKNVRLCILHSLTFFVLALSVSCKTNRKDDAIEIIWEGKKAVSVRIQPNVKGNRLGDLMKKAQVRLAAADQSVSILGEFGEENGAFRFTPLIPFTRGLRYEILINGTKVGSFKIPEGNPEDAPILLGIFPSADTLPENLLKIYLKFSQPMREGQSGSFVTLIKNNSDTIKNAFLDLQPELWNADRTMLTLWLDPGRIKRDLQPNKKLGAPLISNNKYRITIAKEWQNQQNQKLNQAYSKNIIAVGRDNLSPQPSKWKIEIPANNTTGTLQVSFNEMLDYGLLNETLSVYDGSGQALAGNWKFSKTESLAFFTPKEKWNAGAYRLRIETRLEDIAGNNINRPFDRDISTKIKVAPEKFVDLPFRIKE